MKIGKSWGSIFLVFFLINLVFFTFLQISKNAKIYQKRPNFKIFFLKNAPFTGPKIFNVTPKYTQFLIFGFPSFSKFLKKKNITKVSISIFYNFGFLPKKGICSKKPIKLGRKKIFRANFFFKLKN